MLPPILMRQMSSREISVSSYATAVRAAILPEISPDWSSSSASVSRTPSSIKPADVQSGRPAARLLLVSPVARRGQRDVRMHADAHLWPEAGA